MSRPKTRSSFALLVPLYVGLGILFAVLIARGNMQLLNPAGYIANFQSKILIGALIFALFVGSTIIIAFFIFISRYREDNQHHYEPNWSAGKLLLIACWGIPSVAILVISTLLWGTAHAIDPYRQLDSAKTPLTVQVVALRWKWLFLYPGERIATVNMLEIPVGTPINLQLTADAPMNSFWVPRLSGQIYAMTGMVTQLHIEANQVGNYPGTAAEINGDGYSGMDFTVKAVSSHDYAAWKSTTQKASQTLNYTAYTKLAQPTSYVTPTTYTLPDQRLFDEIVMQFMAPDADQSTLKVRGSTL